MRRIINLIYLTVVLGIFHLTTPTISAQTLHAIIACNTTDRNIGNEMAIDMRNVRNQIQTIASILDCEYDEYALDGPNCTKAKITDIVKKMEVDQNKDIIFFYYGGHGSHANNNSDDPWPQMCMNTNIQSLYFPVKTLDKMIAEEKKPRLQVMIMDCCNQEQDGVSIKPLFGSKGNEATSLKNYNPAVFKKLFLETKGNVKITSSELGQLSWSRPNGSIFTNNIIEVFDEVGTGTLKDANWLNICNKAQAMTFKVNDLPDGVKQKPYFEVKTDDTPAPPVEGPTQSNTTLYKALQTLLTKDQSKEKRLANISSVKNKFFTSDAHIVTVGKNGTSKIMYEDVDAFLRRLALSDNIKQINVLDGNDKAKNTLITVHEVRY